MNAERFCLLIYLLLTPSHASEFSNSSGSPVTAAINYLLYYLPDLHVDRHCSLFKIFRHPVPPLHEGSLLT